MLERQAYGCAICRSAIEFGDLGIKRLEKSTTPHVDHCHRAEDEDGVIVVRGLLCGPCNSGLGHFRDDPAILLAAAQYLTTHADYRPVGGSPKRSKHARRTIDEERAIVADYLASPLPVKRFANARGLRASTVYRLLRLYGEETRDRKVYGEGSLSPAAKLDAELVREIFVAYHQEHEDATAIASRYGVTRPNVMAVVERKTWRDATHDLVGSLATVRPDARRKLTGPEEAAIIAAVRDGMPGTEVAAAYDIAPSRVSQIMAAAGEGDRRTKFGPEVVAAAVAAVRAKDGTWVEIAARFGMSPARLSQLVAEAEGRRPKRRRANAIPDEVRAAVLAGLAAGRTQDSLAAEFGVSQPFVSRLARSA